MKFYLLVLFTFININLCQAQFNKGTQMLSGNVSIDLASSKNNTEDYVSPFTKNNNEENKYGFGIELGYGKFKKVNTIVLYGLGYSYLFSEANLTNSDTSRSLKINSVNNDYRYTIFAENLNFIPLKNNWGITYSFKGLFAFNTLKSTSKSSYYYNYNDSSFIGESSSDGANYLLSFSGNLGAYYTINKHFLLFSQLNVFTANLNFFNNTNTYLGNVRKTENAGFGFNLTGALTPTFKLGDISIGLKYLIYK